MKKILQGIANAITSDDFMKLFGMSAVTFLLGMLVGCSMVDTTFKKQCDEMSITDALQYPYCRSYFEEQLKEMED